jgi:hypothetical protein
MDMVAKPEESEGADGVGWKFRTVDADLVALRATYCPPAAPGNESSSSSCAKIFGW